MSQDEIYDYIRGCVSPVTARQISLFLNKDVTRVEKGLSQLTKFRYLKREETLLIDQTGRTKRKTLINTYTLYKKIEEKE